MRSKMTRTAIALGAVVAVALAAGRLEAHHSVTGLFDERKTVQINGVLTGFRFLEPHGLMSVEIRNARGRNEVWGAETNGSLVLGRRGWTKDSLRIGEAVTVEGFPAQGGAKRLRVRTVTRADGTVLIGTLPR
jgi:hypothetical protein